MKCSKRMKQGDELKCCCFSTVKLWCLCIFNFSFWREEVKEAKMLMQEMSQMDEWVLTPLLR